MLDALRVWRRFAGLPVFMVQWSRIKIAGEVRAAHAPVKVLVAIKRAYCKYTLPALRNTIPLGLNSIKVENIQNFHRKSLAAEIKW